jgi:DNA-binding response OmpR family regulator
MKTKIKILHLEDNPYDAELIREHLNENGFSVELTVVDTQNDFQRNLQTNEYDLILSDFALPTFNGKDALLLAKEIKPDIPFIFLSGTMGEDAAIESLVYGATDYVLKNKPERLIPAINRAIQESEIYRAKIQAENELRLSEEKYRAFVNEVNDGFFINDINGNITFANNALAAMVGFNKAEELIGHNFQ